MFSVSGEGELAGLMTYRKFPIFRQEQLKPPNRAWPPLSGERFVADFPERE